MTIIRTLSPNRGGSRRTSPPSDDGVRVRVAADAVLSAYVNDISGQRPGAGVRAARDPSVRRWFGYERARRRPGLELACAAAGS